MHKFTRLLSSTLLLAGIWGMHVPNALAATSQKTISVNGTPLATVPGIVHNNTTYMPIWYVMRALSALGIHSAWDGHDWVITVGAGTPLGPGVTASSGDGIVVNGSVLFRVNHIVSGNTTYMPIWYIMQMLKEIGVQNTWNGQAWNITGTVSGPGSSTGNSPGSSTSPANKTAVTVASPTFQNAATDDSLYWSRAGKDIYIMASSYPTFRATFGPSLLSIEPGDPIYLTVASSQHDVTSSPQWSVNSPDATISPGPSNYTFSVGRYKAGVGVFRASKPGIYTIQAESNGVYSEPLVLLVGVNQLTASHSLAVDSEVNGIQALPASLPSAPTDVQGGITYKKYQPINGWLPVSGSVSGVSSVVVWMETGQSSSDTWAYRLPVKNGHFSGLLRLPLTGSNIVVSFHTHFNQTLTTKGSIAFTTQYTVSNQTPISRTAKALLSSAEMDVNMSPAFANEASVLMENAPSRRTGITAINNFVAEKIEYDTPDYLANKTIWSDSLNEWTHPVGVCQNIAELAATMLKSIGVPTETILGSAPVGSGENHEWIQPFTGSTWTILDPTWDAPTSGQTASPVETITNQYNDNSLDFQTSHTPMVLGGWE